jgi:hypothetical protein
MKRNLRLFETAAALKCCLATALVFIICFASYAQKPKKAAHKNRLFWF